MLKGLLFFTLTYLCQGYLTPRVQNWFQDNRLDRFLSEGAGEPRGLGPGSLELRQAQNNHNHDNTNFCPLPPMTQHRAVKLPLEPKRINYFAHLARVIHALWNDTNAWAPLICTAAMVRFTVFITAARCIAAAKLQYTTVVYRGERLPVKAFILPTRTSKQMFDDTGLIVTYFPHTAIDWMEMGVILTAQLRPEGSSSFDWFDKNMRSRGGNLTVVGYLASENSPSTHSLYQLTNMRANTRVCNKLYPAEKNSTDYRVPCVNSCTVKQYRNSHYSCKRYMFGLGHLVYRVSSRGRPILIGIVTWTCGNRFEDIARRGGLPLPLGIAAVTYNQKSDDMDCAGKIADFTKYTPETVHKERPEQFKKLCEIGSATRTPQTEFEIDYKEYYPAI